MIAALYLAYLLWLTAGWADFRCHRRTDLAHTSGLRESSLHLLQLALIGGGTILALTFELGRAPLLALAALVAAHAWVGYRDTCSAYGRRDLRPIEQHLHSVLDAAPVAAWTIAVVGYGADDGDWGWRPRRPPLPPAGWMAVLAPALLLCVWPALSEFRSAWRARRAHADPKRGGDG